MTSSVTTASTPSASQAKSNNRGSNDDQRKKYHLKEYEYEDNCRNYGNENNESTCSAVNSCSGAANQSLAVVNNYRWLNQSKASGFDQIDEEHGCDQYEMSPLVTSQKSGLKLSNFRTKCMSGKIGNKNTRIINPSIINSSTSVRQGNDDQYFTSPPPSLSKTITMSDADDTKNHVSSDSRSRRLFLQTAFWISCWYGTSLATLFLNKIILSRQGSSVHLLGMCQMTAAAVLGGWSAYGGAEWIQKRTLFICEMATRHLKNEIVISAEDMSKGNGKNNTQVGSVNISQGKEARVKDGGEDDICLRRSLLHADDFLSCADCDISQVTAMQHKKLPSTTESSSSSASLPSDGVNFHFVRDMSIVGLLRALTVALGLISLEHVPVSFVETIKATAPVFTVLFARLILQERTATPVLLTLIPVVVGLVLCSASELKFDIIGFVAAVLNNCADCVQNVMSKRMLAHLKPIQLQFYTSVAALILQAPLLLRDAKEWASSLTSALNGHDNYEVRATGEASPGSPTGHQTSLALWQLLILDAIFYHLQSVSAYCTMGCMNPVSQSVANTLKRALLVWASILYFGNPITVTGVVGISMVVTGVFLYNHFRRMYHP